MRFCTKTLLCREKQRNGLRNTLTNQLFFKLLKVDQRRWIMKTRHCLSLFGIFVLSFFLLSCGKEKAPVSGEGSVSESRVQEMLSLIHICTASSPSLLRQRRSGSFLFADHSGSGKGGGDFTHEPSSERKTRPFLC